METSTPTRARHQLLIRHGADFVVVSALVYDPPSPRGTVFCVHDFAGNAEDFETMGRFLAGNGYRVVCPDLPGRGLSATMPTISGYHPGLYTDVLAQVIQSLATKRTFLLGKGWGGLIALLFLQWVRFDLRGLIIADVEPGWSVDDDPMLVELRSRSSLSVPTPEAARSLLRSSPEFEGCSAAALDRFARARFGETPSGLSFKYDPRIIAGLDRLRGIAIDWPVLFTTVHSPMLYMRGRALEDVHHAALAGVLNRCGGAAFGGLSEGARVHFDSTAELVVLQGFLSTRHFLLPSVPPAAQ